MSEDLHIWPPLTTDYQDVFGEINLDVYNAAGEIWQQGRAFARNYGIDDAIAHTAMIRAVAKVSRRLQRPAPNLKTPGARKAYLFTAFTRCLFDERQKKDDFNRTTPDDVEALADDDGLAAQIERKILLEEIVRHMDPKTRYIYEQLTLGYSFEEIAEAKGTQANRLRSAFSKRLEKNRLRVRYRVRGPNRSIRLKPRSQITAFIDDFLFFVTSGDFGVRFGLPGRLYDWRPQRVLEVEKEYNGL